MQSEALKVIADKYIPYLSPLLETVAEVQYLAPSDITPEAVRDADALFVRTRTHCNAQLLDGSRVRWIGTATIGYDHIDRDYCQQHHIAWTNAPGCNAQGVCDYVESALHALGYTDGRPLTLGIVGVGHVGRLVEQMALRRGWSVLRCDPPRAAQEGGGFVSLEELAAASDVITFHTPLSKTGPYPSWHLANEAFFQRTRPETLIINAARGGVVDEAALLASGRRAVIDCWEGEPHLNEAVLRYADLATFHIAGYTRYGKYSASQQVLTSFSHFFGLNPLLIEKKCVPLQAKSIFDIRTLSEQLKARPDAFEQLREEYPLR